MSSTIDDDVLTALCETAAAEVADSLGNDIDDSDLHAVQIGARFVLIDGQSFWSGHMTDNYAKDRKTIEDQLDRTRERRIAGLGPLFFEPMTIEQTAELEDAES